MPQVRMLEWKELRCLSTCREKPHRHQPEIKKTWILHVCPWFCGLAELCHSCSLPTVLDSWFDPACWHRMYTRCWSNPPAIVTKQLSNGHCNDSKHGCAFFGYRLPGEETSFLRLGKVCIKEAVSGNYTLETCQSHQTHQTVNKSCHRMEVCMKDPPCVSVSGSGRSPNEGMVWCFVHPRFALT